MSATNTSTNNKQVIAGAPCPKIRAHSSAGVRIGAGDGDRRDDDQGCADRRKDRPPAKGFLANTYSAMAQRFTSWKELPGTVSAAATTPTMSPAPTASTASATTISASTPGSSTPARAPLKRRTRAGLIHAQCPAFQIGAIQSGDCSLGLSLIRHFHETKSPRFATELVPDDVDRLDLSEGLESSPNILLTGVSR